MKAEGIFNFLKIFFSLALLVLTLKICLPLKAGEPLRETAAIMKNEIMAEAVKKEEISSVSPLKEYETPSDIKNFSQEYIKTYASAKEAGKVREVFFRKSGATDSQGNIFIKNTTKTKKPDFSALLSEGADLSIEDKSSPAVLIFHTHTTEGYLLADNGVFYNEYKTRSTDGAKSVVRVGDAIAEALEDAGISVIHDKTIYDSKYTGAYARSREGIEKILEENPSIKITLDIHRDAVYYSETSRCKPTAEIKGRKAAQVMLLTGAEEDFIKDFPLWEKNLRFALEIQKKAQEKYEGLMKPLFFCTRKYNMDITANSLLIEVGTDANTLEEAVYSGHLLGNVLGEVILSHIKEN